MRALELLYLMLPAYFANMAPPFARFWRGWNRPIHRGLFGDHKTVIGFALGVAAGLLVAFAQARAQIVIERLWVASDWVLVGVACGFGAMLGDSLKSFFKRRVGIAPGSPWIPADQLDFALGALAPLAFLVDLSVTDVAFALAFTFVADIAVNHIAFRLRVRDTAW